MKYCLILVSAFTLIGCSSKKNAATTKPAIDSVAVAPVTPEMAKFNEGKILYEQNCRGCHKLFTPAEITEEQWQINVPIMTRKVNKNEVLITPAQQELILNYVLTAKRNAPTE